MIIVCASLKPNGQSGSRVAEKEQVKLCDSEAAPADNENEHLNSKDRERRPKNGR